jgi:tetratricopeptide (TPR) repeat protein
MINEPSNKKGILVGFLAVAGLVVLSMVAGKLILTPDETALENPNSSDVTVRPTHPSSGTGRIGRDVPPGTSAVEESLSAPIGRTAPMASRVSDQDLLAEQLNNEGLAHYGREEYSEAVELFQKAYDRDSRNPVIRNNLALAKGSLAWKQLEARRYQDALANFQEAVSLKEDEPVFLIGEGLAYYRLNQPDQAVEVLKAAIDMDGKRPDAYKIIGDIYYQQDEIDMAIGYYEKGLELDPVDQTLRQHLAKARREAKAQSGFRQQASRAFTILFDGREETDAAQRVLGDLELAYHEIGRLMSYYPPQSVTVILYTDQQFQDVTRSAAWSKGIYDGKIRIPVGGAERNPDLLRKVVFHEYAHAVVHGLTQGVSVPTWFNEGIAVYFEGEGPAPREEILTRQIRTGSSLVPLSQLHGSFMAMSGPQAALAYAESYAAVKALADRYGLYRIRLVLEDLGAQKNFSRAFSDRFMIPYDTFEADWENSLLEANQ